MGGPGFTAPGRTSGMLRPLIVTAEASVLQPPEPDIEITISNSGLAVTGTPSAGSHIVRVRVEDMPEGFIRHNVHLARLEGDVPLLILGRRFGGLDLRKTSADVEGLGS